MKLLFALFIFLSFNAKALTFNIPPFQLNMMISNGSLAASLCEKGKCVNQSNVFSDIEVENVGLIDLFENNQKEIQIEVNGSPSSVYYLYAIENREIKPFTDSVGNQLIYSSFENKDGYIITHIQSSPQSVDNIYKIEGNSLHLVLQDKCIDCGEITRKDFISGESYIVTDHEDFFLRKPLFRNVVVQKSSLRDESGRITKGYLIKGDKCQILGYSGDDNQYTKIRYGKNKIITFVKTEELQ